MCAEISAGLGLDPAEAAKLVALAEVTPQAESPSAPVELLDRLEIPAADQRELLDSRPDPEREPALWWLFRHCCAMLRSRIGTLGDLPPWPALPESLGGPGRYLYPWVFLATIPQVREYHRQHGIDEATSWSALACLGAQMRNYRTMHGRGGLHTQDWLTFHFRGAVYPLGRLHFERTKISFQAAGGPEPGEPALGVHIPEGRLTPESCDESIARARGFFARHFPDEPCRYAVCSSWVLDPQLREYLGAHTNIIRFLDRFQIVPAGTGDDDATVVEFIFKRPRSELERLPQDTSLQRAIVNHIRSGRHWQFRTGWFAL